MRYEDFKELWLTKLAASKLHRFGGSEERLDLQTMGREFAVRLEPQRQDTPPFLVTAQVRWKWDALLSARSETSDDDALREVLASNEPVVAAAPWTRVDVVLSATLPWEKPAPMPSPEAWVEWTREVLGRLENIERLLPEAQARRRQDGLLEVLAWQETPEASLEVLPSGRLALKAVTLRSGVAMSLPHHGGDNEEEQLALTESEVEDVVARLTKALGGWSEALDHLVRPVR